MRRIRSACCARTESGQESEDAAVTLPSSVMNSRRLIASPRGSRCSIVSGRVRYVRFGSKADSCSAATHVRFTPNSDKESRHVQCTWPYLLRAKGTSTNRKTASRRSLRNPICVLITRRMPLLFSSYASQVTPLGPPLWVGSPQRYHALLTAGDFLGGSKLRAGAQRHGSDPGDPDHSATRGPHYLRRLSIYLGER